ncbi:NERD domain-containing protein [Lactobacillus sp.]|uniref:NERD domain-containing protein n=1 Tax=Lactobacillus sp. TaxID=1591 RepID=UPI003EFA74C4
MNSHLQRWFVTAEEEKISNDDVVASALALERRYNPNYNLQVQLSADNISKLKWINKVQTSYNKLSGGTLKPVLSQDQLSNVENLVAGDAGERLVDQAMKKVVNDSNAVFRNVVLPYEYGQQYRTFDNQIDNLVVTNTGIYCIEVKTRSLYDSTFNFKSLAPDIYSQISYHRNAVRKALLAAGIPVHQRLIKNVIVIVSRNSNQDFGINNLEKLPTYGATAVNLDYLNVLIDEGFNPYSLAPKQIKLIEQVIRNSRLFNKRSYPNNIRLQLTQPDLDQLVQMDQAVRYHVPIEQNVTYNLALNDAPLGRLTCNQQNFFWQIVARLFGQGQTQLEISANELNKAIDHRIRVHAKLDRAVSGLAEAMQVMPLFQQVNYKDGKLTVVANGRYLPLFNNYSSDFTSWNSFLFKNIKSSNAKSLFRKLVQFAEVGIYQPSFQELRQYLGMPECYPNYAVVKMIDRALLYLVPFFKNLTYELKRGRSNKIVGISFSFAKSNPEKWLAFDRKEKYLRNIDCNPALTNQDKELAKEIFEKNFYG